MHGAISPCVVDVTIMGRWSVDLADSGNKAAHHALEAVSELCLCRERKLKERRHEMPAFKMSEAVVSADPVIQPKLSPIRSLRSWLLETIPYPWLTRPN